MPFTFREFDHGLEMVDYLNGVVYSKPLPFDQAFDVGGLTVIIGATTVTFVGTGLRLNKIVDQINAVSAGSASIRTLGQRLNILAFVKNSDVVKGTGTANAILGLPAVDQTVGASAVTKAEIVSVFPRTDQRIGVIHE